MYSMSIVEEVIQDRERYTKAKTQKSSKKRNATKLTGYITNL